MKKLLSKILYKWPFKVLFVIAIAVALAATGIANINLSTGNETMIDPSSDTYIDNNTYQTTFGADPIMVIIESTDRADLLSMDTLSVVNDLNNNLKDLDGVFYVNSPVSVINYATSMSLTNYQNALDGIATNLAALSENIALMSENMPEMDSDTLIESLETIIASQNNISTGLDNEILLMDNMSLNVEDEITLLTATRATLDPIVDETEYNELTRTITVLSQVNNLYSQMTLLSGNFSTGTAQTAIGLQSLLTQLTTMLTSMSQIELNLTSLGTNLFAMSETVSMLADNFNMFTSTFPTEASTLNTIIYSDGVNMNPMLETYFIDDSHIFVNISLEEGTSNEEIEVILAEIENTLANTAFSDSLISGKPVLNYDIKSSMMDSMKTMMITSLIIMVVILLVLFPVPFRLLPLFIVLIAVVGTIGVMGIASIPLTMVSMAVFPVLIGLGIDYSIQFHNRYTEELTRGVK
ncbi:MAG: MMPL family transporter [Tenericutes bacterium]|nr:MMPL family transporter [Mycoplasmatota bacterium]